MGVSGEMISFGRVMIKVLSFKGKGREVKEREKKCFSKRLIMFKYRELRCN